MITFRLKWHAKFGGTFASFSIDFVIRNGSRMHQESNQKQDSVLACILEGFWKASGAPLRSEDSVPGRRRECPRAPLKISKIFEDFHHVCPRKSCPSQVPYPNHFTEPITWAQTAYPNFKVRTPIYDTFEAVNFEVKNMSRNLGHKMVVR